MKFTDPLELPYPEPTDYAALALYMQRLAETIEARILAQRAVLTDYETQPLGIWRGGIAFAIAAGVANDIDVSQNLNLVFANYTNPLAPGAGPFFPTIGNFSFYEAGLWEVGFVAHVQSVGAISTGTNREITGRVLTTDASGVTRTLANLGAHTQGMAGLGDDWMGAVTTVEITEADRPRVAVELRFSHENAASNMQLVNDGMLAWIQRLGSSEAIEVV